MSGNGCMQNPSLTNCQKNLTVAIYIQPKFKKKLALYKPYRVCILPLTHNLVGKDARHTFYYVL